MKYRSLFTLVFSSTLLTTPLYAQQADSMVFGIVPQQAASKLAKMWVPFMNELSAETGMKIKFATMRDIPSFERCLAKGAYDIAYMNPYHYTTFSAKSGYRAFAHQSEKKLKGLIVVKKGSTIKSLQDLDNQRMAYPSPAAFGASVLPRAELKAKGIQIEPKYVKSHTSVYLNVAKGLFPAGGGVLRTFNNAAPELKDQLEVVHYTNAYTPHAFAVNATVKQDQIAKLQQAMLKIAKEKPALVKKIGMKGFDLAADEDWNDVRALNLTQDQTEIAEQGTDKCRLD